MVRVTGMGFRMVLEPVVIPTSVFVSAIRCELLLALVSHRTTTTKLQKLRCWLESLLVMQDVVQKYLSEVREIPAPPPPPPHTHTHTRYIKPWRSSHFKLRPRGY